MIKVGTKGLEKVRKRIAKIEEAERVAAYRAVNAVAAKGRTEGSKRIRAIANLSASYLNRPGRFWLDKASVARPEARIVARKLDTRLATYGAKQLTKRAKRAKGDTLRGIPAGRKQAGISVKVLRAGARKRMPGAFLVPLRAGKAAGGNSMGVFIRTGKGRGDIEHLYSLSVYQLFLRVRPGLARDIGADFGEAYKRQLAYEIGKLK